MTAPLLDCPRCGGVLAVHVGHGQSAPLLCAACCRGWWLAELTPAARSGFDPHRGHGRDSSVTEAVRAERDLALARKHSVHPDIAGLPGVAGALDAFLARGRP